jgi:hypothetical protein
MMGIGFVKPSRKRERKPHTSVQCAGRISAACASQTMFVATPRNKSWTTRLPLNKDSRKKLMSLLRPARLSESVMRMSMNTALSGSGRVDDIKGHPQGEVRGLTKLVKITEDVRKFAAQQGVSEQQALQKGLQEKSREFVEQGSELYAKT